MNASFEHPKTLRIFFATEMWERYGFYAVQTLLALYLALHFRWHDKEIYELVGSFTALTYLSPVLGGWIADRLLGQKVAIILGGMVLLFSYLFLSLSTTDETLGFCLAGIVVGTGLLKPNISSLLGNEYLEKSPHREAGFTIFYMGVTSGIILGTTLPSYLHHHYSWSFSFLSAAFGMVLALMVFVFGIYQYRIQNYHHYKFSYAKISLALLLMLALWAIACCILNYPLVADVVFILVVLLSIGYVIHSIKNEKPIQAMQTKVLGLLCLISVMFWAFYFQMFMSLTLFIVRVVDPTLFGFAFPPPYYVGIQSVGMIVLGLFLSWRKQRQLSLPQQNISTGNKFLTAMFCMSLSYGLITIICHFSFPNGLLSPLYLIPAYLLLSFAELLLSPVGLAAITVLACRKKVSTMMGIFFVSLGFGGFLAGKISGLTVLPFGLISLPQLKMHYAHAFEILLMILLAMTGISIYLNKLIKNLMLYCARSQF